MTARRWISTLFLSLFCITGTTAAPSEPFALKGVAIGAPVDVGQLRNSLGFTARDAVKIGGGCVGITCGLGVTTIAGANAEISVTVDADSHVVNISAIFPAASFSDIDAALRAKYGDPTGSGKQTKQNLAGARFQVTTEYWTDNAGNKMSVTSNGDATRGFLLLQSKSEVDRQAAKSARAKGDI
jgi:hypothetical protein